MQLKNRQRGFTLIELMVVVVIVAILASIAYPGYRSHVIRTQRSEAQGMLTQIANQQERYFTRCNRYARTPTGTIACGTAAGNADTVLGLSSTTTPNGFYTISFAAGNISGTCSGGGASYACGYTLIATPGSTQAGNGKLRMDATGLQQWDKTNNDTYGYKWTDR